MSSLTAKFAKIRPEAVLPTWGSEEAAGCDLYALDTDGLGIIIIAPGKVKLIPTGLVAIPPEGYHWELVLRSGTAVKYPGLVLANSIGIIDSDYCGPEDEIKIALLNASHNDILVQPKTRIAQLLLKPNMRVNIEEYVYGESNEWQEKSRGGFGSTGER